MPFECLTQNPIDTMLHSRTFAIHGWSRHDQFTFAPVKLTYFDLYRSTSKVGRADVDFICARMSNLMSGRKMPARRGSASELEVRPDCHQFDGFQSTLNRPLLIPFGISISELC